MFKRKASANKKVRNATPTTIDGIKFRSKLEAFTYNCLKQNNIPFEYEAHKYEIQPKFVYIKESVRPITWTPDFVGDSFIIECKGWANDAFPNKLKQFKYWLYCKHFTPDIYIVHSNKEVLSCVEKIKEKIWQN